MMKPPVDMSPCVYVGGRRLEFHSLSLSTRVNGKSHGQRGLKLNEPHVYDALSYSRTLSELKRADLHTMDLAGLKNASGLERERGEWRTHDTLASNLRPASPHILIKARSHIKCSHMQRKA